MSGEPSTSVSVRPCEELAFRTSDGVELFFRCWKPVSVSASSQVVVLFHRGHEHSARWQNIVDGIELPDFWIFAWDARGHGRSPGERGYAESFGRLVRDADEFVRYLSITFRISVTDMAIVAQSVGAVIAAAWVHDYAPPIRALVIGTPAFQVRLYVPLAIPGLRLLQWLRGKSFIRSYVRPGLLTHDPAEAKRYADDPLISPQIAVNILLGLYDTSARLITDAGTILAPTLLLISGADWVVEERPQLQFLERLSSAVREKILYPGFYHSTFWEKDRALPIAAAREFLLRQFQSEPAVPSLLNSDTSGFTRFVYDELRRPLPLWSPKRLWYALQWAGMQTLGRLSKGIQAGWKSGFDSGESLDHVYRNTPEGVGAVGRWIDRVYLDSPGWTGIRQRKVHLQAMLERALQQLITSRLPGSTDGIHILDIAAGPGRYLLEFLHSHRDRGLTATLRDRSDTGLSAGRQLSVELGVHGVNFESGDAFDEASLSRLQPRPSIAVVSGLYELFPENELIRRSLRGLAAAIRPDGYLLYTNQPWHPQQEMIARVLPNRDGAPWVMRCRSQAEMDQLVAEAGFVKIDMLIDDQGIFSVSLAIRTGGSD